MGGLLSNTQSYSHKVVKLPVSLFFFFSFPICPHVDKYRPILFIFFTDNCCSLSSNQTLGSTTSSTFLWRSEFISVYVLQFPLEPTLSECNPFLEPFPPLANIWTQYWIFLFSGRKWPPEKLSSNIGVIQFYSTAFSFGVLVDLQTLNCFVRRLVSLKEEIYIQSTAIKQNVETFLF